MFYNYGVWGIALRICSAYKRVSQQQQYSPDVLYLTSWQMNDRVDDVQGSGSRQENGRRMSEDMDSGNKRTEDLIS